MKFSIHLIFLFSLLFVSLQTSSLAHQSYIVYFGGHSHGREATSADHQQVTDSHYEFLGSFLGSKEKAKDAIFYSYTKHINGFAAYLEPEEADRISKHPEVVSVFPNQLKQLHTTHSWSLLGLEDANGLVPANSLWEKARFGEDIIIANLDTGVWPESESFNDEGFSPVPSRWKGSCQNNTKEGVPCNRKLIGAKYFNNGFDAKFNTTRDSEGHGTHTLSTAGGSFAWGANIFTFANGTAKGGSPKARVAAYRVCADDGCSEAAIMAAFDEAIHDGVDVVSVSLGGSPTPYIFDAVAISSFHAVKEGIVVIASAGNAGPSAETVTNVAPWIITVGASTLDRDFPAHVFLGKLDRKHKQHLHYVTGQSLSTKYIPHQQSYPMIDSKNAKAHNATLEEAQLCRIGSLDPEKVKGKIVVCLRGINPRVEKGAVVRNAGGIGFVLANDKDNGNEVTADPHFLPAAHITYSDGLVVYSYLNSTKSPVGYISRPVTEVGVKPTPVMAAFSSRGPNAVTPAILKPDVTAPGVNVLAAYPPNLPAFGVPTDHSRTNYTLMSGTSMSCPHVSGIVGLLRSLHPHWSPAAIKSAIITSATTRDNKGQAIKSSDNSDATPLDYGAGHVQPNGAVYPGLVYDLTVRDYLNFLCASGYSSSNLTYFDSKYSCPSKPVSVQDLNYPSITVTGLKDSTTVLRTVTNVGTPGTYTAKVHSPKGVSVTVKPNVLQFHKLGEEKTFEISFKLTKGHPAKGDYAFGDLVWSDGKHQVRSPIVVQSGK